jgi:hypothetical protein
VRLTGCRSKISHCSISNSDVAIMGRASRRREPHNGCPRNWSDDTGCYSSSFRLVGVRCIAALWRVVGRAARVVHHIRGPLRVIESAIRAAQNLLWQNLPPTHKLPDAAAVARLRDLVRSPAVKSALLHSNDTFLAFVLRAVEFVLADQFRADREIIDYLWDVLDDPQLNKALGLPQNSQMTFRRSRF